MYLLNVIQIRNICCSLPYLTTVLEIEQWFNIEAALLSVLLVAANTCITLLIYCSSNATNHMLRPFSIKIPDPASSPLLDGLIKLCGVYQGLPTALPFCVVFLKFKLYTVIFLTNLVKALIKYLYKLIQRFLQEIILTFFTYFRINPLFFLVHV